MEIENIEDLNKKEIKDFIELFTGNNAMIPLRIGIILEKRTSKIIKIFDIQSITFPDETNSKRFSIKGKDLYSFIQTHLNILSNNVGDLKGIQDDLNSLKTQSMEFSENMFGCICYGKFGY